MLTVRAFVALGALTPDDVAVQVVHGVIDAEDDLVDTDGHRASTWPRATTAAATASTARSSSSRGGAFGYTVRVVPAHSVLASVSELGLVALP